MDVDASTLGDARADGTADGSSDGSKESGVDAPPSSAPVWGYISRSVTPVLDGKGPLYVVTYIAGLPLAQANVGVTDLSFPGAKVLYELYGIPAGTHQINAFLDDNANALTFLPVADPGDLALSSPPTVTVGTASVRQDLVLDIVIGAVASDSGPGDAFAEIGAIRGVVRATATPQLDGKGGLHVTLHSQLPPAGLVAATSIAGADLSSPFAGEAYFLGGVKAGSYYLRAFLDDNENVNPFAASPDPGDLVHGAPIQVHVVGGTTNYQDIVLDEVQ